MVLGLVLWSWKSPLSYLMQRREIVGKSTLCRLLVLISLYRFIHNHILSVKIWPMINNAHGLAMMKNYKDDCARISGPPPNHLSFLSLSCYLYL